jgi:transcriptional regulator with XRE-family HTH domain
MSKPPTITGAQVRMARAFLRWSVAELARKADVGISTVQRIEASEGIPEVRDDLEWRAAARSTVIEAVRHALVDAGITFLPDDGRGVGIRGEAKGQRSAARGR